MKMETVIRAPQNGTVAKLVHKEGVRGPSLPRHRFYGSYTDDDDCRIFAKQALFSCFSKRRRLIERLSREML